MYVWKEPISPKVLYLIFLLFIAVLACLYQINLLGVFFSGIGAAAIILKIPEIIIGFILYSGAVKMAPFLSFFQDRIDITLLSVLLLGGYLLYAFCYKRESLSIKLNLLIPASLLICLASFSLIFFHPTGYGLDKYIRFVVISVGCCFFLCNCIIKDQRSLRRVFYFVIILSSFIGVYALLTNTREGFASNYLFAGRIAGMSLIICAFLFWQEAGLWKKSILSAAAAFFAFTMLGSGARGPFIALIISCVIGVFINAYWAFTRKRLFKILAGFLIIVIGFLACMHFNLVPEVFVERMSILVPGSGTSDHGRSYNTRVMHVEISLEIMSRYPLMGVGWGNYIRFLGTEDRDYPHNIFLEIGSEFGLPALFIFCLIIMAGYLRMLQMMAWLSGDKESFCILITIFTLFTYLLFCVQFSGDLNDNKDLWFMLGAVYSLGAVIRPNKERDIP